jgi:hypothetical protein
MNIFKKLFGTRSTPYGSQPTVNINDVFVDTNWGDTKIQICQLHKSKPFLRYKFLMIDGKPIVSSSSLYEMPISFLVENYTQIQK